MGTAVPLIRSKKYPHPENGKTRAYTRKYQLAHLLSIYGNPPPPPLGVSTWTHLANGAVALLRVDPTQSSETGTVRGLRWHNLPREGEGVGRQG